jgi:WD40 repeat protein
LLASASENARVRLWEARSGTPHHALQAPSPQLGAMSFSRDGGRLVTSSEKGALCLWDVHSGQLLHSFERHLTTVKALAFSPDGGTLASASMEGRLCCWDLRTGTLRHTELLSLEPLAPGEPVNTFLGLAFSPDGEVLTAVRHTGDMRSWDTRSYTPLPSKQGRAQSHALLAPDGRTFACASWEGMVRLRAMRGGRGGLLLSVVEDTWVAFLEGTPFFIGGGDLSRILHFTSGDRAMSAQLWAPLFQRPELVRAALAGQSPDLTALGLNSSVACEAALVAERTRRGLVRRRSIMP